MKKFVWTVLATICACVAYAQEKDVTRFLGIPVDGSKSEMIQKLEEKGFQNDPSSGLLRGEFNGRNVFISIVTNKNKVYRIMIYDKHGTSEAEVKIQFNTLCRQFENNINYLSAGDWYIPDDEQIAYEMTVHKKQYQAAFYQRLQTSSGKAFVNSEYSKKLVWFKIFEMLGEYYIIIYYDNEYNRANGEDL